MLRRLLDRVRGRGGAVRGERRLQAELDFSVACAMLEINELFRAKKPLEEIDAAYESIQVKWRDKSLDEMVPAANEWMTTQLSEMFQHLHDVDSGDLPIPATLPRRPKGLLTAAEQTSIGPSTHTNPLMTLDFQMQQLFQDNKADALRDLRLVLTKRHGFSLWVGPTQAPTPSHKAGIYLKGVAQAGTVVAIYPGAVFNAEMRLKASDAGHLANPKVPRLLVPRYDDTVIDVYGGGPEVFNPFAVAHHVRHPPSSISPNCLRIQFDFIDGKNNTNPDILDFPAHLAPYIPNVWGTDITGAQALHGMMETAILMKSVVLITTRQVADEELFVDHQLNPFQPLPSWYVPRDPEADKRVWRNLSSGRRLLSDR